MSGGSGCAILAAIEALDSHRSIQEIAFDMGYSTGSAFIAMFQRQAGCTPEQYRRSHLEAGRCNRCCLHSRRGRARRCGDKEKTP